MLALLTGVYCIFFSLRYSSKCSLGGTRTLCNSSKCYACRKSLGITDLGEEEVFSAAKVATAFKGIKSRKAAGEDEIRPEMLKALTREEIIWQRVCVNLFGSFEKLSEIGRPV